MHPYVVCMKNLNWQMTRRMKTCAQLLFKSQCPSADSVMCFLLETKTVVLKQNYIILNEKPSG